MCRALRLSSLVSFSATVVALIGMLSSLSGCVYMKRPLVERTDPELAKSWEGLWIVTGPGGQVPVFIVADDQGVIHIAAVGWGTGEFKLETSRGTMVSIDGQTYLSHGPDDPGSDGGWTPFQAAMIGESPLSVGLLRSPSVEWFGQAVADGKLAGKANKHSVQIDSPPTEVIGAIKDANVKGERPFLPECYPAIRILHSLRK